MEDCCGQKTLASAIPASKFANALHGPSLDCPLKDNTQIKGCAYHEGRHAVVDLHFERTLQRVAIVNSGKEGAGGVTISEGLHPIILQQRGVFWEGTPERWRYLSDQIMMRLAGEVAQMLFCPASVEPHHSAYDRIDANCCMKKLLPYSQEWQREEKMEELLQETRDLLNRPRYTAAVEALAQALIGHKDLSGKQATAVIVGAIRKVGVANNTAR